MASRTKAAIATVLTVFRHDIKLVGYRPGRTPNGCQQNYPRPKRIALCRRRRTQAGLKHHHVLRRYPDLDCFGNHPIFNG